MNRTGFSAAPLRRAGVIAVFAMLVMAPTTFAQGQGSQGSSNWFRDLFCQIFTCSNGSGGSSNNGGGSPPNPAATPELGSIVLFGSGLMGLGAYGMTALRARRRPTDTVEV